MAEHTIRTEVRREVRTEVKREASGFSCRNHLHEEEFKTREGILKLVELLMVLLALILASAGSGGGKTGISSIEFFIFVTTSALISSIFHILLILIGIYRRLPNIILSNVVNCGIYALAVVMFLISSIVLIASWGSHGTLAVAAIFGFICTGLFFVELMIWFARYRSSGMWGSQGHTSDGGESGRQPPQDEFSDPQQQGY